jgi:hypothetical protein
MSNEIVNVVYVLSDGRSGSTLLDMMISTHPEVVGVGEMKMFHRYVPRSVERKRCTCGEELQECALWGKALADLTHDYDLPLHSEKGFEQRNYDLLSSVAHSAEASWVCDSSKDAGRLDLLLQSSMFNVQIIHLARDPRAVAYSNVRKRKRVLARGGNVLDAWRKYNYFRSIMTWRRNNPGYVKRYSSNMNYMLIRYEDIVERPAASVSRIWERMGLEMDVDPLVNIGKDCHNIGGNHVRRENEIAIKKDEAYIIDIPRITWWLSSLLIRDALSEFGYSMRQVENQDAS